MTAQKKSQKTKVRIGHNLTESKEDYLEAIYHIEKSNKVARVKEIAASLKVKMPSVSGALKTMAADGLISHDRYGYVQLTEEGKKIAAGICARHENITEFLVRFLNLERGEADRDACRIEHAVGQTTFERLSRLVDFVRDNPEEGEKILSKLHRYF